MTQALGDDSLNPKPFSSFAANIVHTVLNYIYIVLIIISFIMALGNRPQGSQIAYTSSMIFFALLIGYMMFAFLWITVVGIHAVAQDRSTFRNIIISLCSTWILYGVSSALFLDPWHMFTSFLQYLFLAPSYINVLNVYAFCNTHDVSWGTKGDNIVATDLGVVKQTKKDSETGEHLVEVELPTEQKDLNEIYQEACMDLRKEVIPEKQHRDAKTKQEDYYRAFRTRLVLSWIISNFILVALITNATTNWIGTFQARSTGYLGFILWSVAALAAIRFIGSCLYLILRLFSG